MILNIRGYDIKCYAKNGSIQAYRRLYETYDDERLAQLSEETMGRDASGQYVQGDYSDKEG